MGNIKVSDFTMLLSSPPVQEEVGREITFEVKFAQPIGLAGNRGESALEIFTPWRNMARKQTMNGTAAEIRIGLPSRMNCGFLALSQPRAVIKKIASKRERKLQSKI